MNTGFCADFRLHHRYRYRLLFFFVFRFGNDNYHQVYRYRYRSYFSLIVPKRFWFRYPTLMARIAVIALANATRIGTYLALLLLCRTRISFCYYYQYCCRRCHVLLRYYRYRIAFTAAIALIRVFEVQSRTRPYCACCCDRLYYIATAYSLL